MSDRGEDDLWSTPSRNGFDMRWDQAVARHEHLWVVATTFFAAKAYLVDGQGMMLDGENMTHDPALGCCICQVVFDDDLFDTPCLGPPEDES